MKSRFIGLAISFIICCTLFYLSGAPLVRGWSLFSAGFLTTIACIVGFTIGWSLDKERKERQ